MSAHYTEEHIIPATYGNFLFLEILSVDSLDLD